MKKRDHSFCTDLFERQTLAFAGGKTNQWEIKLMSCKTISAEIIVSGSVKAISLYYNLWGIVQKNFFRLQ